MRFSIRDLLWVTLLAAVAVAWWIDRSRLAADAYQMRALAEAAIAKLEIFRTGTIPDDAMIQPGFSAPAPNPPK